MTLPRYVYSARLRAAQLEYSRAESALGEAYDLAERTSILGGVNVPPHFEFRPADTGTGRKVVRMFIRNGCEPSLRFLVGDETVDRWLNARGEVDALSADPRHYRVEGVA